MKLRGGAGKEKGDGTEWRLFMKGRVPEPVLRIIPPLVLIYKFFGFVSSAQVDPFVLLGDPLITLKLSVSIRAHNLVLLIMNEPPLRQRKGIISYKQVHQYFI